MMKRMRIGRLTRTTLAVLGWNVARLATQFAWIVLLARSLGADGYGGFSGIAGLAIAMSGFAGAGLGMKMYQDVARNRGLFAIRWAQATRAMMWSTAVLVVVYLGIGGALFPQIPAQLLLAVALAELALSPFLHQAASAYAAMGWVARAAAVPVVLSMARVVAALTLFWFVSPASLLFYAWLHLVTTAVAVAGVWLRCRHDLGESGEDSTTPWPILREGLGFTPIWVTRLAQGSLDKTVVLREAGAGIAGQYAAAQRFASLAALPVESLAAAVMPKLFEAGGSREESPRLLLKLLVVALGYGSFAGLMLWLTAGLMPLVLGAEFAFAVPAVQVLSIYVPAYCLRAVGANILLGYGFKRWRVLCEVCAAGVMIALMVAWLPAGGVVGAAKAVLTSELMLAILFWARIVKPWVRAGRGG